MWLLNICLTSVKAKQELIVKLQNIIEIQNESREKGTGKNIQST